MNARMYKMTTEQTNKIYNDCVLDVVKSIIAVVIYVLYRRGWHKDNLQKLFADIKAVLEMPPILGKQIEDDDIRQYVTLKCGIDFDSVKINLESDSELRKRRKEMRHR